MRNKIRMRGWCKEEKVFYKIHGFDLANDVLFREKYPMNKPIPSGRIESIQDELYDFEIDYWTGQKDKNGVDIYTNDFLYHKIQETRIVYYPFSKDVSAFGIRQVDNGMASTLSNALLYEVIGNKHEHPELIGDYGNYKEKERL